MGRFRIFAVAATVLVAAVSVRGHGAGENLRIRFESFSPGMEVASPRMAAELARVAKADQSSVLLAQSSSNDSPSLSRSAYAAYSQIYSLVQQIDSYRNLAASNSATDDERATYQTSVDDLIRSINRMANSVSWNGNKVLLGTSPTALSSEGYYSSAGQPTNPRTQEEAPAGTPAGDPWERIVSAVSNLSSGDQRVWFTYSFMGEGAELCLPQGESTRATSKSFDSVSSLEGNAIKQEIRESLAVWEDLFERVFNPANGYGGSLEINFIDLGAEEGTTPSYAFQTDYEQPVSSRIGDFRYAMEDIGGGGTAEPFSPSGTPASGYGDDGGDIHFNTNTNWRTDRSALDGVTGSSVKIVSAHEVGHALCFVHDQTTGVTDLLDYPKALMNPNVITQNSIWEFYPDGLYVNGPSERAGLIDMYGSGATLRSASPITFSDATTMDLPSVNAATLAVSAVKVRTQDEAEDAEERVSDALTYLSDRMSAMRTIMNYMSAPTSSTPTGPPVASFQGPEAGVLAAVR